MPATANTRDCDGTTTESRGSAIVRGGAERAGHLKRGRNPDAPRDAIRRRSRNRPTTSAASAAAAGGQRLAQTAGRQRPIAQVVLATQQQIDVALELEMLKPIVQQVDRRAELASRRDGPRGSGRADEHRARPAARGPASAARRRPSRRRRESRVPSETTVTPSPVGAAP